MAEARRRRLSRFARHAWIFAAGAVLLLAADVLTGEGAWAFWPIAAWALALGVHYLFHKARRVDQDWVEERTADLHSKSYDAGHIDAIRKDHREP